MTAESIEIVYWRAYPKILFMLIRWIFAIMRIVVMIIGIALGEATNVFRLHFKIKLTDKVRQNILRQGIKEEDYDSIIMEWNGFIFPTPADVNTN